MKCPDCHAENTADSKFCSRCSTPLSSASEADLTRTLVTLLSIISKGSLIVGKYRILEEIGHGGMGVVYKAEDLRLKRQVALPEIERMITNDDVWRNLVPPYRLAEKAEAVLAASSTWNTDLKNPDIVIPYDIVRTLNNEGSIPPGHGVRGLRHGWERQRVVLERDPCRKGHQERRLGR